MNDRISITIKPTLSCNMRCRHCYHADSNYPDDILDIHRVERILNIASNEYSTLDILIHGGEPTFCGSEYLNSIFLIEKKIENVKGTKFYNTIQTNGLELNSEIIDILTQNNCSIGISFDGPHNSLLRTHSEQVLSNIKVLQNRKIKTHILCVETKQTISNLLNTYEWFKSQQLDYKILSFIDYNQSNSEYNITPIQYANSMFELFCYWCSDLSCNINASTIESFFMIDKKQALGNNIGCIGNRIAINPDGTLYPCGRPYPSDYIVGNIDHIESLSDCFESDGYQKVLHMLEQRKEKCKQDCAYFSVCNGGCISNAILDGSCESLGGNMCLKTKLLLEKIIPESNRVEADIKNGNRKYNPGLLAIFDRYYEG